MYSFITNFVPTSAFRSLKQRKMSVMQKTSMMISIVNQYNLS